MNRDIALWTGLLLGPLAWLLSLEANFALAPWACAYGWKAALFAVTIVAFALSAGAGFMARREWQRVGRDYPGEAGGAIPRARTMAIGGMLLSAFSCLVILAQAIPNFILGACQ